MRLIFDARALRTYPVGREGFHGGTELYLHEVARGLSNSGHTVHVVTPDLEDMEQRGVNLFYWPPTAFPTRADAVVMMHNLDFIEPYEADLLILASNGVDPILSDDMAQAVDLYPCFSQVHVDLLCQMRPAVDRAKCHITGLGTHLPSLDEYRPVVSYRMLYCNDPTRGLWHVLEIFDRVRVVVPEATLHVAYNFHRQFEIYRWQASPLAEAMWLCQERIGRGDGVQCLGNLSRDGILREMAECQVHAMPSDPRNVGSQIHGIAQLEMAAMATALVLSDTEAFPEIFGEAATILPVPGAFMPGLERRCDCQDWAEVVVDLMRDSYLWRDHIRAVGRVAQRHTWDKVVDRWEEMLNVSGGRDH